jgi:hypothetical protein
MIISSSWDKEEPINVKFSQPIHLQISPFVRGSIPFNQIAPIGEIASHGAQILLAKKFKVGQRIEVTYLGQSRYSLIGQSKQDAKKPSKGAKH